MAKRSKTNDLQSPIGNGSVNAKAQSSPSNEEAKASTSGCRLPTLKTVSGTLPMDKCKTTKQFSKELSALGRVCYFCGEVFCLFAKRSSDMTVTTHINSCACPWLKANFAPGTAMTETYRCQFCQKEFYFDTKTISRFLSHLMTHKEAFFPCFFCGEMVHLEDFSGHVLAEAKKKFSNVKCNRCKQIFLNVQDFYDHLKTTHRLIAPNLATFKKHIGTDALLILALFVYKYESL